MTSSGTHIANHTTLALVACVGLSISVKFLMEIAKVFKYAADHGPGEMTTCMLLDCPSLIFFGLNEATACAVLSLERYWKIVHLLRHRQ